MHAEVCEDMWVPVPPSHEAALARRERPAQPLGLPDHRRPGRGPPPHRPLVELACTAAYAYAAASGGESTTDLSWDGMTMVYEMGLLLGQSERFPDGPRATVVDVDLDAIRQERMRQVTFDDNAEA